jgi:hypothetical protein
LKITLGSFRISQVASHGAPPVSTTTAANFVTGTAGGVDTSAKFATGVNDLEGKNLLYVHSAVRCKKINFSFATCANTGGAP